MANSVRRASRRSGRFSSIRWTEVALLFLVAVFPCWGATLTCNSTTVTSLNAFLVCSTPLLNFPPYTATAGASISAGTNASVYASNNDPYVETTGIASASVQFDVVETWTVLGGTGDGLIYPENFLPFITASVLLDPDADDVLVISGLFGLSDGSAQGLFTGAAIPFTFGVPFSFDESVTLIADDGEVDGGRASVNYDTTSETYQIEPITSQTAAPWQFYQAGSNLTSITLERSAVLAPEPSLLLPFLAVLLVLGTLKFGPMKKPTL
jgi:hypothetical protein